MIINCSTKGLKKYSTKLLEQAARELLLSQSSDWSFILRAGTTTELAKERIHRHLSRFWSLIGALKGKEKISKDLLNGLEKKDHIFPLISIKDWSRFNS